VGQSAICHHPRLALPVADKLMAIGERAAAIKAAETARSQLRDTFYH
jgi:hypothetical protein